MRRFHPPINGWLNFRFSFILLVYPSLKMDWGEGPTGGTLAIVISYIGVRFSSNH